MNSDDFEQKLRRQELRPIPAEWRDEILQAANDARQPAPAVSRPPGFLSIWFWPSPKAWAGLAALWLVIFGFHFSSQDRPTMATNKPAPSASELRLAYREQQRVLAELMELQDTGDADRPRPQVPRPRSARRNEWLLG